MIEIQQNQEQTDSCEIHNKNLLVLDYYDGPVSGAMYCSRCDTSYGFDLLDISRDHRHRLFMLFKINSEDYAKFEILLGQESMNYDIIKEIIRPKITPDKLIVWDNSTDQLNRELNTLSIANIDASWKSWLNEIPERDWFAYLGISLS